MVDIIKINKPLSSLSATKRVKPVGHRLNNNQQNLFKDNLRERQKKKKSKKDLKHVTIAGEDSTADRTKLSRHALTNNRLNKHSDRRIIDLMV